MGLHQQEGCSKKKHHYGFFGQQAVARDRRLFRQLGTKQIPMSRYKFC